jgi:hypothetical protein
VWQYEFLPWPWVYSIENLFLPTGTIVSCGNMNFYLGHGYTVLKTVYLPTGTIVSCGNMNFYLDHGYRVLKICSYQLVL